MEREMEARPFQVRLLGHKDGWSTSGHHRLVQVELREIDYIRINNTATSIDSRCLAELFLDIPDRDFSEPSIFERTLSRSISGVMDLNRDYFLDVVIPETVTFAYNTGFRTIKMAIELLNLKKKICNGDACAICLEELSSSVEIMPCLHAFHQECARRWLDLEGSKGSNLCPVCRKECFTRNPISYLGLNIQFLA